MEEVNQSVEEFKKQRKLLLKTVGIPETKPYSIIIPPNEETNGFGRISYHHEYCNDFISKIEFDEVIDNVCKLASAAYSVKRENDNKQLSPKVIFVFYICLLFNLLFCIMSYFAAIEGSSFLRIFSLILLAISTAVFSFITLSIIFQKMPDFPSLHFLVKKKIEGYFENINQIYIKKGFWWRIAPELLYVEMRIPSREPEEIRRKLNESDEVEYDRLITSTRPNEEGKDKPEPAHKASSIRPGSTTSKMSKAAKTSKVVPMNTYNTEQEMIEEFRSPEDMNGNQTLKSQPIRFRNRPNQELNQEFSRNESGYSPAKMNNSKFYQDKNENSRINYYNDRPYQQTNEFLNEADKSDKLMSPVLTTKQDNKRYEEKRNSVPGYFNKSKFGSSGQSNPKVEFENEKEKYEFDEDQQKHESNQNVHEEYEEDSHEHSKDESRKMDEILSQFDPDPKQGVVQNMQQKQVIPLNAVSPQQKYGFQDQNNSHFGSEWMSEKEGHHE